ncbi:hypothetical protein BZK31_12165 [Pseudomonas floridensis]|uniref:HrpA n=1 Tax=Pseudomonas floridensis TaxID=1958950 RepID=A0A1X0N664_9PSED|nr:hypothetical protein [Pseudomonas floridensis]ORC59109.1 hypothetical protein BZK31_12165 [Pseudomonas floridensis]
MNVSGIANKLIGAGGDAAQGIQNGKTRIDSSVSMVKNSGSTKSIDATREGIASGDATSAKLDKYADSENAMLRETSAQAGFEGQKEALSNQIVGSKIKNALVNF